MTVLMADDIDNSEHVCETENKNIAYRVKFCHEGKIFSCVVQER